MLTLQLMAKFESEQTFYCIFTALLTKRLKINGSAYGNRTRLSALRGPCPNRIDERATRRPHKGYPRRLTCQRCTVLRPPVNCIVKVQCGVRLPRSAHNSIP